jgi:hypothetical protein
VINNFLLLLFIIIPDIATKVHQKIFDYHKLHAKINEHDRIRDQRNYTSQWQPVFNYWRRQQSSKWWTENKPNADATTPSSSGKKRTRNQQNDVTPEGSSANKRKTGRSARVTLSME